MHNFFLDKFDVLRLAGEPEKLSEELRPIHDLFSDVQDRADSILQILQKQFGISPASIDREAKQLLKNYQSSDKELERDAP